MTFRVENDRLIAELERQCADDKDQALTRLIAILEQKQGGMKTLLLKVFRSSSITFLTKEQEMAIRALLNDIHEADIAQLMEVLSVEDRLAIWRLLGKRQSSVLPECNDAVRLSLAQLLPAHKIASILTELSPALAQEILRELPRRLFSQIVVCLPQSYRKQLFELPFYRSNKVGANLTQTHLYAQHNQSVGDFIREAISQKKRFETNYCVVVVNDFHEPVGIVRISTLLTAPSNEKIILHADKQWLQLNADDDMKSAAEAFGIGRHL